MQITTYEERIERNKFFLSLYEIYFKASAQGDSDQQEIKKQLLNSIYTIINETTSSNPKKIMESIQRERTRLNIKPVLNFNYVTLQKPIAKHNQDKTKKVAKKFKFVKAKTFWQCFCDYSVIRYTNLFKHITSKHMVGNNFVCPNPECKKKFKRASQVIYHLQDVHQEFFICCKMLWKENTFKVHRITCQAPIPRERRFSK